MSYAPPSSGLGASSAQLLTAHLVDEFRNLGSEYLPQFATLPRFYYERNVTRHGRADAQ